MDARLVCFSLPNIARFLRETAHRHPGASVTSLQSSNITGLLHRWADGDAEAIDEIVPIVYERLRQLARQQVRADADASLNTTELVHEAYLKLVDTPAAGLKDRGHFFALASRVMRHLLVDHARARKTSKRGSGQIPVAIELDLPITDDKLEILTELDDALKRLEALDERQARILEQRYFGGLSLEETAEALGVSLATVKRELRSARAWLAADLRAAPSR